MITLDNHCRQLSRHGVDVLTGEACAYMLRTLFDYNQAGKSLLEAYFGTEIIPNPPWNASPINNHPRIGCIMLTYAAARDLAIFSLLHADNCTQVLFLRHNVIVGIEASDKPEKVIELKQFYEIENALHNPGYDRNTHQFSGRTY